MENTKRDEFVDIPGYEGIYQINLNQEVKRCQRYVANRLGGMSLLKEKILSPYKHNSGYIYIQLDKSWKLHRLMALAFIENKDNLPQVNHRDGNKANNEIDNLEWCTNRDNARHAFKLGLRKGMFGAKNHNYHKRGNKSPLYGMTGGKNMAAKLVLDTYSGIFYDCVQDAAIAKNYKSVAVLRHKLNGAMKNNTTLIYA